MDIIYTNVHTEVNVEALCGCVHVVYIKLYCIDFSSTCALDRTTYVPTVTH